jgi:hypothetical protein
MLSAQQRLQAGVAGRRCTATSGGGSGHRRAPPPAGLAHATPSLLARSHNPYPSSLRFIGVDSGPTSCVLCSRNVLCSQLVVELLGAKCRARRLRQSSSICGRPQQLHLRLHGARGLDDVQVSALSLHCPDFAPAQLLPVCTHGCPPPQPQPATPHPHPLLTH